VAFGRTKQRGFRLHRLAGSVLDDLSAFSNSTSTTYAMLDGYIVEFSGFDGGSPQAKSQVIQKQLLPHIRLLFM
jgi:hypothetical protein